MTTDAKPPDAALTTVDANLLERQRRIRVERMRGTRAAGRGPVIVRPEVMARQPDRASTLARDVGGSVEPTSGRPIVVVETRTHIPVRLQGLEALPVPVDPSRPLVLLDTETTALGTGVGTFAFLVGIGRWQGSDFVTTQLLLPEQSDEPGYLDALEQRIEPDAWLVSYNGKTFDWPLLVSRFRLLGRRPPPVRDHLDLLPLARTLWRHRLADARLASVEQAVCGVRREHDLPGGLVPARYLDYLRTGHGGLLREVLEHNRQDVVSMALLLKVLAEELAPAAQNPARAAQTHGIVAGAIHAGDLGGLGRAYARRRRHDEALACFDRAMERLEQPWQVSHYESIAVERARTLTRLGYRAEAEGAWHAVALEGGSQAAMAWCHVAKHREHDHRDFRAALAATDRARALAERARLFGRRDRAVERDLARRVPRLRRRLVRVTDG